MNVTVNGKQTGSSRSVLIVVLAAGTSPDRIRDTEEFIRRATGRLPYTWIDGTGTITVGDSATNDRGCDPSCWYCGQDIKDCKVGGVPDSVRMGLPPQEHGKLEHKWSGGMHEHDGLAAHSHEVRWDHAGVPEAGL